jgi:DNA-binding MarR family transcriptional regulator
MGEVMTEIDQDTRKVLTVIDDKGGEATTSDVLEETSIDQHGSVHYRFEKLRDAGMIEDVDNDEQTVKVRLTEDGERYIESGKDEGVQALLDIADATGADLSYSDGSFDDGHFHRSHRLYQWVTGDVDSYEDESEMYDEKGEMTGFMPVSIIINELIDIPEDHGYPYDCVYVLEEDDKRIKLNVSDDLLMDLPKEVIEDLREDLRRASRMKRDMLIYVAAEHDDLPHSEIADAFDISQSRVTQIVNDMKEIAEEKNVASSTSDGEYTPKYEPEKPV